MINVPGLLKAIFGPIFGALANALDPVDLGTGLFVYEKTDLSLPGPLPLELTRVYRQGDNVSRPFGIGMNYSFNVFLTSAHQYSEADLNLGDGGQIHYVRTSPGTGWSDAVFEAQTTPSPYYKSKMTWNGNGWDLRLKNGTVYVFGENQPLQAIRDRHGNQITFTRTNGQAGNVTQITGPSGRWIRFNYDGANRITQATDNSGRSVAYTYDAKGRMTTATDVNGGVTTYTWDACPTSSADTCTRILSIKDPRNITFVTNEYDANGRVSRQTVADGSVSTIAYTVNSGKVTQADVTDGRGNVRRVVFNVDGFPTSDTHALGEPEETRTTYRRQAGTNLVTTVTDALDRITDYGYDAAGNVTSVTRLAGTAEAATTSLTYTALNDPATITDPLNHTTSFGYDAKGNLTSVTDPLAHRTTYTYNPAGQPLTVTDPLDHTTTFGYELRDSTSVTDARGNTTTRFVDAAGRAVSTADPLGNVSRIDFDALNQPTKVTDAGGGETTFTYDGNGNQLTLKDPRGKTTTWTYDSMDRPATRKDPLQRAESYDYDPNGNLTGLTDRRGVVTTFGYDALDRPTFVGYGTTGTAPNQSYTSTVSSTYDAGGRLSQLVDSGNGTISEAYDDLDRLKSETTPQGTVTYGYDAGGRRTSMSVPGQAAVTYGYDDANRPTSIRQDAASVAFAYDAADRLTSLTLPNGIVEQATYNDSSQPTALTYKLGDATLGDLQYDYDAAGRRTAAWGSYARVRIPQAVSSATYDDANELTHWDSSVLSYDDEGNLVDDGTNTYGWNNRGQLTSIAGGTTASFRYDAAGRRRGTTIGGTATGYLYDGDNVVQEQQGGSATVDYLTGLGVDQVFSHTAGGSTSSLLRDALGSTVALADTQGTVQTSYTYEPFGKATASGATSGNRVQFTGRENDGTGLAYYRARYYSPTLQRFISQDPLGFGGGDLNVYGYVGNGPTNFADPSGLFIPQAIGCVAGGAVGYFAAREMGGGRKAQIGAAVGGCALGAAMPWVIGALADGAPALPAALEGGLADVDVYFGEAAGQRVYVGITNNLLRRAQQHAARFLLNPITRSPVTRGQARAIEQAIIERNPGFQNVINSISPTHSWYDDAVRWGQWWLKQNGWW
jgi:RHS repeat-associated protein